MLRNVATDNFTIPESSITHIIYVISDATWDGDKGRHLPSPAKSDEKCEHILEKIGDEYGKDQISDSWQRH